MRLEPLKSVIGSSLPVRMQRGAFYAGNWVGQQLKKGTGLYVKKDDYLTNFKVTSP